MFILAVYILQLICISATSEQHLTEAPPLSNHFSGSSYEHLAQTAQQSPSYYPDSGSTNQNQNRHPNHLKGPDLLSRSGYETTTGVAPPKTQVEPQTENIQSHFGAKNTLDTHKTLNKALENLHKQSPEDMQDQSDTLERPSDIEKIYRRDVDSNSPPIDQQEKEIKMPQQTAPTGTKREKRATLPWNITDIITEGYDARLRPNFGMRNNPVIVDVDILVASVDRISEVNMDYTLTIYLRQYWTDDRLAYAHVLDDVPLLPVDGRITEKLWLPDTYFTNDKDSYLQDITVKNRMLRIKPHGQIIYGLRLSVTASCVFELKKFPHDKQNCSLNLESYGYNTKDIRLNWAPNCVQGFGDVELPQFRVTGWNCTRLIANFSSGAYDRLFLLFYLERSVGYFVFQTYMPCIMVVCMSWVSFWINYESSPARVALGITTVLTMTTIFTSARASLPRFSYVKAIDIYLLTCFVFVFASLIEYAVVNYNFWKIKHRLNKAAKSAPRNSGGSICSAHGPKGDPPGIAGPGGYGYGWHHGPVGVNQCSVAATTANNNTIPNHWSMAATLTPTAQHQQHFPLSRGESSPKKTRKSPHSSFDVLSPDQMIALRLSTPNSSEMNRMTNTPDLPRKVMSGHGHRGSVSAGGSVSGCSSPGTVSRNHSFRRTGAQVHRGTGSFGDRPRPVRLTATATTAAASSSAAGYLACADFSEPLGMQNVTLPTSNHPASRFAKGYVHAMHQQMPTSHSTTSAVNDVTITQHHHHHQMCDVSITQQQHHMSDVRNLVASDAYRVTANGSVIKRRSHQVKQLKQSQSQIVLSAPLYSPLIGQTPRGQSRPLITETSLNASGVLANTCPNISTPSAAISNSDFIQNQSTIQVFQRNNHGPPAPLQYMEPHQIRNPQNPSKQVTLHNLMQRLAKLWDQFEIPSGERVIIIDRYSRCLFPTAFILFNAAYWWYYVL